jgi:hypothetical protein
MIPQNYIIEWKNSAPWKDNAQVEQDLILSRAIVALYSDPILVPTPPVIEKVHGAIFERLEAAVYKGFFVFLWQT